MSLQNILKDLIITPLFFILIITPLIIIFAKFLSFRKAYVNIILTLFEYGRQNIESARPSCDQEEEDFCDDAPEVQEMRQNLIKHHSRHGSDTNVIVKGPLTMVPEKTIGFKHEKFLLEDCLSYITSGMEAGKVQALKVIKILTQSLSIQ